MPPTMPGSLRSDLCKRRSCVSRMSSVLNQGGLYSQGGNRLGNVVRTMQNDINDLKRQIALLKAGGFAAADSLCRDRRVLRALLDLWVLLVLWALRVPRASLARWPTWPCRRSLWRVEQPPPRQRCLRLALRSKTDSLQKSCLSSKHIMKNFSYYEPSK